MVDALHGPCTALAILHRPFANAVARNPVVANSAELADMEASLCCPEVAGHPFRPLVRVLESDDAKPLLAQSRGEELPERRFHAFACYVRECDGP
jgi:hypothetical protein